MSDDAAVGDGRLAELAANLGRVRARLAAACQAVGRDPGAVSLVAITKTWPADDVRRLAALGVRDVGENRDQEARPKAAACAGLGLVWHFVGQLQTNKARSVAGYADVVHSVDRPRLVAALDRGAAEAGRAVGVLLEVALDGEAGRGGATPAEVPALAALVAESAALRLLGVMGVAPLGADPAPAFARLAAVSAALRSEHPQAGWISAGMSGDLEAAIAAGATHVRVGTALLGRRAPLG
jgi:pyridoxal phosphate enzyme (YggS family)